MPDQLPPYSSKLSSPATACVFVTKADTDLVDGPCRTIVCGTAGTLNFMDMDGTIRTGFPLQAGYNPIRARQIRTGGTADNIWALY